MKKSLLFIIAFLLTMNIYSQNWNLKNVPSTVKRTEGASQIYIDVRTDMPMNHTMWVRYTITGKNSGALISDFENFNFVDTIFFAANDSVKKLTFNANLDNINPESNDTFLFKLVEASMGTIIPQDSTTIIVYDSIPPAITGRPVYKIGTLRGANLGDGTTGGIGTPDSTYVSCTIRGVLYGINRRTTGYNMYICDGTGCMGMFSGKSYANYSGVDGPKEGDSVEISGTIEHFRGLGQIRFDATGDTIKKLSFSTINSPTVVTVLDENSESKLVKLEEVYLSDGTWLADSNFNLTMKNTSGTSFSIRIENNPSTNFSSITTIKSGKYYTITGMGSQFDQAAASEAKSSGYQILPRKLSDIVETGDAPSGIANQSSFGNELSIFPSIANHQVHINIFSDKNETASLNLVDMQGKTVENIEIKLVKGDNLITIDQLSRFNNGLYFIDIQSENIQLRKRFTIAHQ